MKKNLPLACFIFLTMARSAEAFDGFLLAGDFVGNGGDATLCLPMPKEGNMYYGYYMIDYIVAHSNNAEKLMDFKKGDGALAFILDRLDQTVPTLGYSFRQFVSSYRSAMAGTLSLDSRIYWKKSKHDLVDVKDSNMIQQLPKKLPT